MQLGRPFKGGQARCWATAKQTDGGMGSRLQAHSDTQVSHAVPNPSQPVSALHSHGEGMGSDGDLPVALVKAIHLACLLLESMDLCQDKVSDLTPLLQHVSKLSLFVIANTACVTAIAVRAASTLTQLQHLSARFIWERTLFHNHSQ